MSFKKHDRRQDVRRARIQFVEVTVLAPRAKRKDAVKAARKVVESIAGLTYSGVD